MKWTRVTKDGEASTTWVSRDGAFVVFKSTGAYVSHKWTMNWRVNEEEYEINRSTLRECKAFAEQERKQYNG